MIEAVICQYPPNTYLILDFKVIVERRITGMLDSNINTLVMVEPFSHFMFARVKPRQQGIYVAEMLSDAKRNFLQN